MFRSRPISLLHMSHSWPIDTSLDCSWAIRRHDDITYGSGSLKAAAKACKNTQLAVAVPLISVSLFAHHLPMRQARKIASALPYLLQDDVLDINDLHLCWRRQGHHLQGACINQAQLHRLCTLLERFQLRPRWVVIDALLLPTNPHGWTIYQSHEQMIVKQGDHQALQITPDALPVLLKMSSNKPQSLLLSAPLDSSAEQLLPGLNCKSEVIPELDSEYGMAKVLIPRFKPKECLNLVKHLSSTSTEVNTQSRPWRWSKGLTISLLLSLWGGLLLANHHLAEEIITLRQYQSQSYRLSFPAAQAVADPAKALDQRVQQLPVVPEADSLLALLHAFTQMPFHNQYQIQSLEYTEGRLKLMVTSANTIAPVEGQFRDYLGQVQPLVDEPAQGSIIIHRQGRHKGQ